MQIGTMCSKTEGYACESIYNQSGNCGVGGKMSVYMLHTELFHFIGETNRLGYNSQRTNEEVKTAKSSAKDFCYRSEIGAEIPPDETPVCSQYFT